MKSVERPSPIAIRAARRRDELEFLPAALEIVETPVRPAGRAIGASIILLFTLAVVWACFGRIDVITSAPGRVVLMGRTKFIQPVETSIVRAIAVHDGQDVKAGQVLIELDAAIPNAARQRLEQELMIGRLNIARLEAAVSGVRAATTAFVTPRGAPTEQVALQLLLLANQLSEQRAKIANLDEQTRENEGEIAAIVAEERKLSRTIPLLKSRVASFRDLVENGFGQRIQYLHEQQDLIEHEQDLVVQKAKLVEAVGAGAALKRKREETEAGFRRDILAQLVDARKNAVDLQGQLAEAQERYRHQTLTAPVDGTVQQLAIHTVGGVVTPAEHLMAIVPRTGKLEIEATVSNHDIGFVHPGQSAEIKIETFDFTKYGMLQGEVVGVSRDAVAAEPPSTADDTERRGPETDGRSASQQPSYIARIALDLTKMQIGDKVEELAPGMAVTAEIKTGKRRIVEFLLSPLMRYRQSALQER